MSQPTAEQWKRIESAIMAGFPAILRIDGYDVLLHLGQLKGLRYAIVVQVDGKIDTGLMHQDCEITRRFWRKITTPKWSVKARQAMRKMSARQLKKMGLDPTETRFYWAPLWASFEALRRHLARHNTDIKVVRP